MPHPAGVRFDVAFQGTLQGPRLSGTLSGVDYIYARADGQFQLHIHAQITTDDGENISFFAEGAEGTTVVQLREKVSSLTASSDYAWLNQVHGLGVGTADPTTGEIKIKVYAA